MDFPTFPEKWYKLFTYLGLIMIAYGLITVYHEKLKWDDEMVEYNAEQIVLNNNVNILKEHLLQRSNYIKVYSELNNIENPIKLLDSSGSFSVTVNTIVEHPDSLLINNVNFLTAKSFELREQRGQLDKRNYLLWGKKKNMNFSSITMFSLVIFGILLLFIGLRVWISKEREH